MRETTANPQRSGRWRRIGLASLLVVGPVAYLVVRSAIYLRNSEILLACSSRFPTDYFVGKPGDPPLLYVALGDSTAVGTGVAHREQTYPYTIAQHLASGGRYIHVVNLGKSGARIADVQYTQLPHLHLLQPEVITMSIGANDATHGTDPVAFRTSYAAVLEGLEAAHPHTCLIATSPDIAYAPAIQPIYATLAGSRAQRQNDILNALTANRPFTLVDLYHRGYLDFRKDPALYASDRFHPSPTGYAIWTALFLEKLKSPPLPPSAAREFRERGIQGVRAG